jgi:glycosyltransferase involved in cell wall biosynthesis
LAEKIRERFDRPLGLAELSRYDYHAANRRWLEFHEEALRPAEKVRQTPVQPGVDVCVTYFNKQRHFPQLLRALEDQTEQGFGVIAVDDGSTENEARELFDAMAAKYGDRGWTFFRQENAFVDAARNSAARRSRAEYLLFVDADDVPAKETVEHLLEAAVSTGDDCILSGGWVLEGDEIPTQETAIRYLPLGPNLITGLVDPGVLGLSMILIRRSVFEALGGYRERRGAAHEDWELQVRLLMAGYKSDVLPECLLYFRQPDGGLAKTSADYPAKQRLIDVYEEQLAQVGLKGMGRAMHALFRRSQERQGPDPNARLKERVRLMMTRRKLEPRSTA